MLTSFGRWIKAHDLLTYFVLAFLFTYAAWSVTLFTAGADDPNTMIDLPTAFRSLGMWGPAAAGIVVMAVTRGKAGLQELFRRVFLWRVPLRWYLLILFCWPVIVILSDFLYAQLTNQAISFQWNGWRQTTIWLAQSPFVAFWASEEIGWRGFALPRLLSRRNALVSSLIVGTIHALWHLPLFFMGNPPLGYWLFTVSLAIFMTWLMNNNRGSVFLAIFFHFWVNVYGGIHGDRFLIANPDPAQRMIIQGLVMAAVAIVVVILYGYRTLTRERKSSMLVELKPSAS